MRKLFLFLTLTFTLSCLFGSTTAAAHHAFTAQYDAERPVSFEGVVVKVEWLNPHAYFYVDVTDEESGEVTTWACELGSPVSLMRQGWRRDSLKLGQVVQVEGAGARDGSDSMNAQSVVVAGSGQRLFNRRD